MLDRVLAFPVYTGHWQLLQVRVQEAAIQVHRPAGSCSGEELVDLLVTYLRTEAYGQPSPDWPSFRRCTAEFSEGDSALHVLQLLKHLLCGRALGAVADFRQELLESL